MLFQSLYDNSFAGTNPDTIAEKYPYFSVAHYFRLQQQQAAGNVSDNIAAKAALHFANPYLLQQQLTAKEMVTEEITVPETIATTPVEERTIEEAPVAEMNITGEETESFEHRVEVEDEPLEAVAESSETVAGNNVNDTAEPVKEEKAPLLFEPLHTTDYFASQGIKLSEVVLSGDKMGRQLKSFTEWLKTMKKVHPEGVKEKNEGFIDPSVQKMADRSNTEEDVITESMADVYIQQGKTNKAKEIYEKLSLLNPSKSAYFAAKLNEIQ